MIDNDVAESHRATEVALPLTGCVTSVTLSACAFFHISIAINSRYSASWDLTPDFTLPRAYYCVIYRPRMEAE